MPFDTVKVLYLWLSDALGSNGNAGLANTEGTVHDNHISNPHTASIMITPAPSDAASTASSERSYFPSMSQSHRSSISSTSTDMVAADLADKATRSAAAPAATAGPKTPLDPLAREYPVPAGELNLDELLAREPGKWSLGHYLKTPTREAPPHPDAQDKERRARELAAAKKELLEEWGSMRNMGAPARR